MLMNKNKDKTRGRIYTKYLIFEFIFPLVLKGALRTREENKEMLNKIILIS